MAPTRPIEIAENPLSSTAQLQEKLLESVIARSSSKPIIIEDHIRPLPPPPPSPRNMGLGLPHKWRPMSDYILCDTEMLKKHGIVKPDATYNIFNLYIKRKDRDKPTPTFYFIKFNTPGSYLSEFEALNAALHNFMVPGIIPSAHVIYDDSKPDNPPVAICTAFDKSFITVKKKPVTKEHLTDPNVVKSLAIIITLAQLLEECDLHGNNFVWSDKAYPIMRVDPGQSLWNYLIRNPKTAPELKSYIQRYLWGSAEDIFPLTVEEFESAPNFKSASPRYCPGGSGKKSIFSDGSSYTTWFSKNAFTPDELEVYRNPLNLQKNPNFNYIKFKLATKFTFLTSDIIKELCSLYLRTTEGPKDKPVKLTHIEDVAKHLEERIKQCRDTLVQSPEFKTFIKSAFPRAMLDIFRDADEFSDKMTKKIKKPQTSVGYAGLFACQNPQNTKASMTICAIKAQGTALDRDALKL